MSSKLLIYSLKATLTGLALSVTAILGFSYLLMMPGGDGDLMARVIETTQELLTISHLLFPLVTLIGIAFGLGLLHNHSEIVQLIQIESSRRQLGWIIAAAMVFTVASERLLWDAWSTSAEAQSSSWQRQENVYIAPKVSAIQTNDSQITGYIDNNITIGNAPIATWERTVAVENKPLPWYRFPESKKARYAWWSDWHQALWPIPLFWLLWKTISQRYRGSNAASIAGRVTGYSIVLGLAAEATHIVLVKALYAPWLTAMVPFAIVAAVTYRASRTS